MSYEVILTRHAAKVLDKLQTKDYKLVHKQLNALEVDAHPPGSIKLKGSDKLYRLRAGNFRIIYEVNEHEIKILVLNIGDRKEVYKK